MRFLEGRKAMGVGSLVVALLLMWTKEGPALPVFSSVRGASCAGCHINPTGGGMRTGRGFEFAQSKLPLKKIFEEASPDLNENISFGVDHRLLYYVAESKRYQGVKNTFFDMQGNLYANFHLEGKSMKMDFLFSRGQYGNFDSLAILRGLFGEGTYIKIGRFVPNFGVRWDDHNAYTRGYVESGLDAPPTPFTPFTQFYRDTGLEAGYGARNHLFSLSVTNSGTGQFDPNIGKAVIASYTHFQPKWMAGASYFKNTGSQQKGNWLAGFAGLHSGKASLISEWVQTNNDDIVSHTELRYLQKLGWHWILQYDLFEPDLNTTPDRHRWSFGTAIFPISFTEVLLMVRNNTDSPSGEKWEGMTVLHFFY